MATSRRATAVPTSIPFTTTKYMQVDDEGVPIMGPHPATEPFTVTTTNNTPTAADLANHFRKGLVELSNAGGAMTYTIPADLSNADGKVVTFFTRDTQQHIIAFTATKLNGAASTSITFPNTRLGSITLRFYTSLVNNTSYFTVVSNVGTTIA